MSDTPAYAPASPWVRRFASLIRPQSRVLDLAAGGGRHTALLRELGHTVTAVDRDVSALAADFADDSDCSIRALDLESGTPWTLGRDYDGIVVTNYLHRPLFPSLAAALASGGILIYETFAMGNERFGKPRNPEFLLRPGELLIAFGTALAVIAFEQGMIEHPRPAVVQRIAAVKDRWPFPLPAAEMAAS
jgi:SAM-dependent methyltransferase